MSKYLTHNININKIYKPTCSLHQTVANYHGAGIWFHVYRAPHCLTHQLVYNYGRPKDLTYHVHILHYGIILCLCLAFSKCNGSIIITSYHLIVKKQFSAIGHITYKEILVCIAHILYNSDTYKQCFLGPTHNIICVLFNMDVVIVLKLKENCVRIH